MSEPPHQVDYDFDYWMNVDLMDACSDPMHDSMGLDSVASGIYPQPSGIEASAAPTTAIPSNFEEYDVPVDPCYSMNAITDNDIDKTAESSAETYIYDKAKYETTCYSCGERFESTYAPCQHTRGNGHLAFPCSVTGCDELFGEYWQRDKHQAKPHGPGHSRVVTSRAYECMECGESLSSTGDLLRHAKERQHRPYSCECGTQFSRLDVFYRHLESVSTDGQPQYPCQYCRRHRGANGFKRRDHLNQHIRNYHHFELDDDSVGSPTLRRQLEFPFCSHPDCPQYRDESFKTLPRSSQVASKPFETRGAYTKHMRDEHNECTFPCDVQGCDRVGRRGYFREKDLMKHRRERHTDAAPYQPMGREMKSKCPEPGCGAILAPSSMPNHAKYKHQYGLDEKKHWP